MNQYYSAELSQKVHRGLNESYRKGQYTGGPVIYGYDVVDKKNVINPEEAEIVKEIFTKYSQGYTKYRVTQEIIQKVQRQSRKKTAYNKNLCSYKFPPLPPSETRLNP